MGLNKLPIITYPLPKRTNEVRFIKYIQFVVYGEPKGKARPRVVRGHAFTPKETMRAEQDVRQAYLESYGDFSFPQGIPLNLSVRAFFQLRKNETKANRESKLNGFIRPIKKPDCDNVIKLVADALNEIAYHDDSQIVEMSIDKWYSDVPRLEVIISDVSR